MSRRHKLLVLLIGYLLLSGLIDCLIGYRQADNIFVQMIHDALSVAFGAYGYKVYRFPVAIR